MANPADVPLWISDKESCTPDLCPTEESIYGYAPNKGANIFFTAFFAFVMLVHIFRGVKHRTWTFLISMVLGGLCEAVGHGGRLLLTKNPFSMIGLKVQLVLLTIAPAFLAGGIYLCLKHIVLTFGQSLSRLPAKWYTYIFVTCDIISLILQGAGGGIAASAPDGDKDKLDLGNNIMMAGLIFQVVTLTVFAVLAIEFWVRVWLDMRRNEGRRLNQNPVTVKLRSSTGFKCFIAALVTAYTAIQIRCVYRIVEMSEGWGSELMQHESLFIVLESLMCAIMFVAVAIFHPGSYLPMGLRPDDVEKGSSSTLTLDKQAAPDQDGSIYNKTNQYVPSVEGEGRYR